MYFICIVMRLNTDQNRLLRLYVLNTRLFADLVTTVPTTDCATPVRLAGLESRPAWRQRPAADPVQKVKEGG